MRSTARSRTTASCRAGWRGRRRPPGSSWTTSTAWSTSSRRRRAPSTAWSSSGARHRCGRWGRDRLGADLRRGALRLGLRLGRHVEGIVDAYYGPPELAAAVEREPPLDPRALVRAAELL